MSAFSRRLIKRLLGLDILKTHGFIVDLNKLELYAPCSYDR